jgi:predicted membrane-bound spermidine synthase
MPEFDSPFHRLRVTDNGVWRLLKFERNHQSSMALDDPFETDIEYVDYLHLAMAVKPDARSALVIGLGGGSLVKRMWRDYDPIEIDAVELDEQVVDIAREYFALPDDERIRIFIDDGRAFLGYCAETYDLIVIDAFDDDHIPRPLLTEEFLMACRDHLSADGVVAYNVIGSVTGDHSKPFRSLYRTVANAWRNVWVFPIGSGDGVTDSTRNMILLASDADLSEGELLMRIATRVDGLVTVRGFERFGEDLYRGTIRSGDVPIMTDPKPPSHKANRRR